MRPNGVQGTGSRGMALHYEFALVVIGSALVAAAVTGLFQLTWEQTVEFWGPIAVLAAMVAISAKLVRTTITLSDVPNFSRIIWGGVVVKICGTIARYLVTYNVYGGGDEVLYNSSGAIVARNIREGVWTLAGTQIEPHSGGTQAIGWILSVLYAVVGHSQFFGYVFFSWLSWLGLVCFYRAFRVAVPDVPSKLFAFLIFFLPSLAYWPSTIGKEAVMVFLLGFATLGLMRLVRVDQPVKAVLMIALSAAGLSWIRPHMALLLLASTGVGLLVRDRGTGRGRSRMMRGVVIALMIPGLLVAVGRVDQFFGGSGNWVESGTEKTSTQTNTGGSAFESEPVRNPIDLPLATVSVTMRPFAWEAGSLVSMVASLEGLLLAALLLYRWHVFGRLIAAARTQPAVAFCLTYVVLFVIAFSNINNEGILVRQRTQMFPFLLFAFAIAAAGLKPRARPGTRDVSGRAAASNVPEVRRTVPGARPV